MVKSQSAVQETRVRSLGGEDPLEEGMETHSNILAWRIPMDRGACGLQSRVTKSQNDWPTKHSTDCRIWWMAYIHTCEIIERSMVWIFLLLQKICMCLFITPSLPLFAYLQHHIITDMLSVTLDWFAFSRNLSM